MERMGGEKWGGMGCSGAEKLKALGGGGGGGSESCSEGKWEQSAQPRWGGVGWSQRWLFVPMALGTGPKSQQGEGSPILHGLGAPGLVVMGGHSLPCPPHHPHPYLLVGLLLLCHHAGLQGQFVPPSPPAHLVKGQKTASVTRAAAAAGTASPPAQRNRRAVRQGRRIPLSVHPHPHGQTAARGGGGWATLGGTQRTTQLWGTQAVGPPASLRTED